MSNPKKRYAFDVGRNPGVKPANTTPTTSQPIQEEQAPVAKAQDPYVDPYAEKQSSALNRRFDLLRQKTEGQANAAGEQANDALSRSAAAHGRLGSGSMQKQAALQQKDLAGQKENAIADIESQREVGQAQLGEQEAARGFQRSERLGGQEFATSERLGGQQFARGERLGSQDYGTSERLGSQAFQQKEMDRQAKFNDKQFRQSVSQFNSSMAMEAQKFKLDERVSQFNMDMATKQFNKKDMMAVFAGTHGYDTNEGKWGQSPFGNGGLY